MNNYDKKKRWKIYLLLAAAAIGIGSLFYTNSLVQKLSIEEKKKAELYVKSTNLLLQVTDSDFIIFLFDVRSNNAAVPVIQTDDKDSIINHAGLDSTKTLMQNQKGKRFDPEYFKSQLSEMKSEKEPIVFEPQPGVKEYIYYKDSETLNRLRYYPYVQLFVIALFLFAAYLAFSSSRKAEQNQVWVGMSKETAHQLGTPISSLLAWIELLKDKLNDENDPLIAEMQNDVKRLELITDRFSKIGSAPVLSDHIVIEVIQNYVDYLKKRTSNKIVFEVIGEAHTAKLNIPLFDWVIENLCKNAINAIGTAGKITIKVTKNAKSQVLIDFMDTGSGIPKSKFETVFQPGYTTRKRGWGLGLSLVKRIIDNYHSGHIFVKESEMGKGTTFRVLLKS